MVRGRHTAVCTHPRPRTAVRGGPARDWMWYLPKRIRGHWSLRDSVRTVDDFFDFSRYYLLCSGCGSCELGRGGRKTLQSSHLTLGIPRQRDRPSRACTQLTRQARWASTLEAPLRGNNLQLYIVQDTTRYTRRSTRACAKVVRKGRRCLSCSMACPRAIHASPHHAHNRRCRDHGSHRLSGGSFTPAD